jgi:aerobic-type carbon monoxide dehydrogenase small subunit (CoxS/CutS family)
MLSLKINGSAYMLDIDPETPLLWILREHLGLTGTKYSCGIAECGACAVHVDGEVVLSCTIPGGEVEDSEITTIEGFRGKVAGALRQAWIEEDVPQCGYCQPGQIMTAAALLFEKPNPTDADIDEAMSGVLCRCGTYQAIRRAIHRAAQEV